MPVDRHWDDLRSSEDSYHRDVTFRPSRAVRLRETGFLVFLAIVIIDALVAGPPKAWWALLFAVLAPWPAAMLRVSAYTHGDVLVIQNPLRRYTIDRSEATRIGTVSNASWLTAGWWPHECVVLRDERGNDIVIDATIGFRGSADDAAMGGAARCRRAFAELRDWFDAAELTDSA